MNLLLITVQSFGAHFVISVDRPIVVLIHPFVLEIMKCEKS
jgi:hypothetical protein